MGKTVKLHVEVNRDLWAKVKEQATREEKKVEEVLNEILAKNYNLPKM